MAKGRTPSLLQARRWLLLKTLRACRKACDAAKSYRAGTLMSQASPVDYIMEDPREALRLELKVDSDAWAQKYLAHRVRPGAQVLSVGCGPGVILSAVTAMDSSIRATGIDISSDRVQQAVQRNRENTRVKFVCGDAQAMEFQSNSFDLVYSRMLLQYLREKEQAVAEMTRV